MQLYNYYLFLLPWFHFVNLDSPRWLKTVKFRSWRLRTCQSIYCLSSSVYLLPIYCLVCSVYLLSFLFKVSFVNFKFWKQAIFVESSICGRHFRFFFSLFQFMDFDLICAWNTPTWQGAGLRKHFLQTPCLAFQVW